MKKKIVIAILCIVVACGVGVGTYFLTQKPKEKTAEPLQSAAEAEEVFDKDAEQAATPTETATPTEEESQSSNPLISDDATWEMMDFTMVDNSGLYSQEEMETYTEGMLELVNKYCALVFNINAETPDYTAQAEELFGGTDDFVISHKEYAKNIYPELQWLHMDSKFDKFNAKTVSFNYNERIVEASIQGYAEIECKNDRVEQGMYYLPIRFIIGQDRQGEWKISQTRIVTMYYPNNFKMFYADPSDKTTIAITGDKAMIFDFNDFEGYSTDYSYGGEHSTNPDDYELQQTITPTPSKR